MADKVLNARMQQKHDIEANWHKAVDFIPLQGEIIVYDKDDNYSYIRMKIGDGVTKITELTFATDSSLSVSGALADSKVVGDAINNLNNLIGESSVADQIAQAYPEITIEEIDKICNKEYSN